METPRDQLVRFLRQAGIGSVFSREKNLNRVAIALARGKIGLLDERGFGRVVEEHGGVRLLRGRGEETADVKLVKGGRRVEFEIKLDQPKIIIDFGLWKYHSSLERKLLLKQVQQAVGVVRDTLWDGNLVFARAPPEVLKLAEAMSFSGEVISGMWEGEAVVLDPSADEEIKRFEENKSYIIGGIVERDRRMRTSELGYDLPRASLRLRGKASLVPDRINLIVRIMCENLAGKPLEKAIEENRGRREKLIQR